MARPFKEIIMPYVNEDCSYCGGKGYIVHYGGMENTKETCNRCNGKGYITHFESISDSSSSSSYDSSSSSSSYTPSSSGGSSGFNYAGDEDDFAKILQFAYDGLINRKEIDQAIVIANKLLKSFTWEEALVEAAQKLLDEANRAKAKAEATAKAMFSAVSIPANASANELSELAMKAYNADDYVKAAALWLKAEEKGCTNIDKGCYSWTLGTLGTTAFNDEKYVAAAELYRKAADMGNKTAMNNLGMCYHNGQGVSRDEAKGIEWYKKAAAAGNEGSQKWLTERGIKW